jgi:para-nitrobenzyl esterase
MVVGISKIWAALAMGAVLAGATAARAAGDQVRIATGLLQGATRDGVKSFKAIPYAAPPVGNLRWQAAEPPLAWSGVRPATRFGPACIQTPGASGYRGPESEDCLTLNVWTPAHRRGAHLPVMMWIHGGGFTGGTGAGYDGASFARDGVVLVTINYRLGRLGFFAHPALAATNPYGALSDYGFTDQIAALRWVKANIAAFGGNAANITIFGESAGAVSVNNLLISPLGRNLFAKAISESSFARVPAMPLAKALALGTRFMAARGITGEDAAAAAAMRALPASALTAPAAGLTDPDRTSPIIDGVVVGETVPAAFAKGDQARVPLIVGGNSFEANLFPQLRDHPDAVVGPPGPTREKAVALFGGGDPARAAANIVTLSFVIEPDRFLAREDARVETPAFVYYFSYVPTAFRDSTLGAGHGDEVAYVFGALRKVAVERDADDSRLGPKRLPPATPEDEAISRAMHAYWVAFAKTGDPGSAGGPLWPTASETSDVLMEFGSDGPRVRRDFDKAKLDFFEVRAQAAHGLTVAP